MKFFVSLLCIVCSLGVAHASIDDCNSLMKSRWESSLADLAALRIDLDVQRAKGIRTSIEQALENSYSRKFTEIAAAHQPELSNAELEKLLAQKITTQQASINAHAKALAKQAAAQAARVNKLVRWNAESEEYLAFQGKMTGAVGRKTGTDLVSIAYPDKDEKKLRYATWSLQSKKVETIPIDLDSVPLAVRSVSNSSIIVETENSLLDINPRTKEIKHLIKLKQESWERGHLSLPNDQHLFSDGILNSGAEQYSLFIPGQLTLLPTPKLLAARVYHQVVSLSDGRFVVVGGLNLSTHEFEKTIEIVDPTHHTVQKFPVELSEGRIEFTATVLSNGKIVLIGGNESVEVIDLARNKIEYVGKLSTKLKRHSAVLLSNDRVLVSGGQTEEGFTTNSILIVDIARKDVEEIGKLKTERSDHQQLVISDHEVLVFGGDHFLSDEIIEKITLKEVYR